MSLSLDQCNALVAKDMLRVDDHIRQQLSSDVVLINQLSSYIIGSGGKRLRPQLVLLAAGACGYSEEQLKKESASFDSLRPSSEMVGLEQAFNLAAAASEEWSPGDED